MLRKITTLIISLFSIANSMYLQDAETKIQFTDFIKKYNKVYQDDELTLRFNIFKDNIRRIEDHNSINNDWKMGLNKFADLTPDEFKIQYTGIEKPRMTIRRKNFNSQDLPRIEDLPSEVDWTAKGAVTPVKDQGQCGSCWAFSTTGSVEGSYFLSSGNLVSFSEQQLVDCSGSYGNQGCNGGLMDYGFSYVKEHGICTENEYGYNAVDGTCKNCTVITKIDSFVDVTPNSETALKQALVLQPVSVAIEADQMSFQFYSNGVLTSSCGSNLDHGVLVTGYGTLNGVDYWKVKNSWGSSWGQNGYILLKRNVKQKSGQCGILSEPSYPLLNSTHFEVY